MKALFLKTVTPFFLRRMHLLAWSVLVLVLVRMSGKLFFPRYVCVKQFYMEEVLRDDFIKALHLFMIIFCTIGTTELMFEAKYCLNLTKLTHFKMKGAVC